MSRKRTTAFVTIGMAIILVAGVIIFVTRQSADTPDRLLSLGEKYLTELNYEQALVQFLKVIEIDPMNPRGYTGAAEAYVGLGRTEDAIAILQQGLERTGDDGIRDMLESIETMLDDARDPEQQKADQSTPLDLNNPDGANYGVGQGNTMEQYLSGGKAIEYGGREYFVISGKLYTMTEAGIKCVLNDFNDYENNFWYHLDGWLGISGNWLYAYSAVNEGGVVRYNILTEEWNLICDFADFLSYTYNPSVLIINDKIVVIEADGSAIWNMDLRGNNLTKVKTYDSSHLRFLFVKSGRLYFEVSISDDDQGFDDFSNSDLYNGWAAWGQIYSMDIDGQNIRQESSKNNEFQAALSAWPSLIGRNAERPEEIDENPSPPIGYELVLPYGDALFCFDGSVIWKVENGTTEAVWQHTDHTTYGNLDFIWSHSGYDSWPDIYRQRVTRPLWIDYPYMVLAEYDLEWAADGSGTHSCTEANLLQTYIFNVTTGVMQQANPYGSVLSEWASQLVGTRYGLGSDSWFRFFTKDSIFELEQSDGEFNDSSQWNLYNREAGAKVLLGTVSEIEAMQPSFSIKP